MTLRERQRQTGALLALWSGQSLDDECIVVRFKGKIPKEHLAPTRFRGVRVFYEDGAKEVRAV